MMYTQLGYTPMKIARIYLCVSTDEQDLTRQADIEQNTRAAGYYIAGVYREKASGARVDRPELLRMIADLQPGEVVVAEKIYRISRLPLAEAEQLVGRIRATGAKLAVPGWLISPISPPRPMASQRSFWNMFRNCFLKLAPQMARDDYETRRERQRQGVQLAKAAGKYAGRVPALRPPNVLLRSLAGGVSQEQQTKLENLQVVPTGTRSSQFDRLRAGPLTASGPSLVKALLRLGSVCDLGIVLPSVARIPAIRMSALARFA